MSYLLYTLPSGRASFHGDPKREHEYTYPVKRADLELAMKEALRILAEQKRHIDLLERRGGLVL